MQMGSDQGVPGEGPNIQSPDQPAHTGVEGQPQEKQPTSAAGGPRPDPTKQQGGMFGEFAPALKKLAQVLGGGPKGPTAQGGGDGGGGGQRPLGGLASFLSGGQVQPRPAAAPQATGEGAPGTSPSAQGAPTPAVQPTPPPQPQFGQQQPLAAFPTTMAHLAQQATPPNATTGPTPPPAAAPETGAVAGAAPGPAAPGAAPDPQLQAIIGGGPQQSLQNLLEGRTQLPPGAPQPQQGNFTAPTQQDVSASRLAGTDTRPTAGFSPYLAQERAPYAKEIDNPRTALKVATMMSFESSRDPVAVAESLMNRTKYSNSTIDNMVSPRFYGPMRKPRMWQRRMAELQRNPQQMQRYLNAYRTAAQGTNLLGGATDQGSGRDPNVNHRGGRVIRFNEIYNDWGGGPGGHAGAAAFRRQQQQRVQAGAPMQVAANETTGQAPPAQQRFNPAAPGDVGTGAGTLPPPPALDFIERSHRQRMRDQGIEPSRRGENAPIRVAEARMPRPRPPEAGAGGVPEGYVDPTSRPPGYRPGIRYPNRQMTPPPPPRPGDQITPEQYEKWLFEDPRNAELLDWLERQIA